MRTKVSKGIYGSLGLAMLCAPIPTMALSTGTNENIFAEVLLSGDELNEVDVVNQSQKKRTVTGTVTDASDGSPVIGANIVVKGTTTGVITDIDGNFTIDVTSKDILEISFIGYKTRQVIVGDLGVINIKLSSDNEMLD